MLEKPDSALVADEPNASDVRKTLLPSRISITVALPRTSTSAGSTRCRRVGRRLAAADCVLRRASRGWARPTVRIHASPPCAGRKRGQLGDCKQPCPSPFLFFMPNYDALAFPRFCICPISPTYSHNSPITRHQYPSRTLPRSPVPVPVFDPLHTTTVSCSFSYTSYFATHPAKYHILTLVVSGPHNPLLETFIGRPPASALQPRSILDWVKSVPTLEDGAIVTICGLPRPDPRTQPYPPEA
uniref:Uncharacterized protein n=1 Tax=Mycena chlorophos TaxID=658473 RepID=A0ABQ0MDQ9_MYCCL|nr:predicted protein [Mycena chlorophos]